MLTMLLQECDEVRPPLAKVLYNFMRDKLVEFKDTCFCAAFIQTDVRQSNMLRTPILAVELLALWRGFWTRSLTSICALSVGHLRSSIVAHVVWQRLKFQQTLQAADSEPRLLEDVDGFTVRGLKEREFCLLRQYTLASID